MFPSVSKPREINTFTQGNSALHVVACHHQRAMKEVGEHVCGCSTMTASALPRYFRATSNYIFCFSCFEWQAKWERWHTLLLDIIFDKVFKKWMSYPNMISLPETAPSISPEVSVQCRELVYKRLQLYLKIMNQPITHLKVKCAICMFRFLRNYQIKYLRIKPWFSKNV